MSRSLSLPPPGGGSVEIEVVNPQGNPISNRPIHIEELLQQQNYSMDIGDGIALRLEALNADQNYSESDSSGSDDYLDDEEESRVSGDNVGAGPPPGTQATTDWYDVLNALRREQMDRKGSSGNVEEALRKSVDGEGRLVSRHPKSVTSVATPLKQFSSAAMSHTKSLAVDATSTDAPPPHASRREVWASLAPAEDKRPHNYKILRYVSFMPALDYRRFRPTALAFHAAASYLNRQDRGQRLLVYGGVSFGARSVEQELYEFSVLTGNWRRLEGRRLVPAGHYGHTMTVVESADRLVVVGGIGLGGAATSKETVRGWCTDPVRAPRYEVLFPLLNSSPVPAAPTLAGAGGSATAMAGATSAAFIGFVSLLFDMNLSDQTWRAIQPASPFPLAFHTAVHFGKELFVFGGLTSDLYVSGQLLAISTETYAVRLVHTGPRSSSLVRRGTVRSEGAEVEERHGDMGRVEAAGPEPRFLHTAVRYGPYMIVFGGYNTHNEVLSDCWAFDLTNERWEQLLCHNEVVGRAGHECCIVGSRMVVTGGFESSLAEVRTVASPLATTMELNLLPTARGEHVWRGEVRVHPPLPPLAFPRCAPCGDGHSFILFGGLTRLPLPANRSESAKRRSLSVKNRSVADVKNEREGGYGVYGDVDRDRRSASQNVSEDDAAQVVHKGLWRTLVPFDDGLVFTFPEKRQPQRESKGERVVNALGVEVDPDELPEHFKTFVRRQEDFLRKKDVIVSEKMRKTTLEEQEEMEPTLHLTTDEIELLIQRSEECCVVFTERYSMEKLPSHVPDRDERLRLIEQCISDSRQVRDVMRSMKGSAPGVTAVKSKTHRKRAGQKFEDYSAAKPFRRVVVTHLIEAITGHLSRMHRLNKVLRTVEWPEKGEFLEAIDAMQSVVRSLSRTIGSIMNKYIQHRVDSLMRGVDKHKEVMRLLTEVVEKNRHDKIWCVEEVRNEKRQEHQRARAAVRAPGQSEPRTQRTSSRRRTSSAAVPGKDAVQGVRQSPSLRSRSLGGGYHADENKAVLHMMDGEWSDLLDRASMVERCADQLRRYCEAGVATSSGAPPAPISLPQTQEVINDPSSIQLVQPQAPSLGNHAPPLLQVPSLAPTNLITPLLPVPPVLLPAGAPQGDSLVSAGPEVSPEAVSVSTAGMAHAPGPRDIIIQHSNQLRKVTAAVAEKVRKAALDFHTVLVHGAVEVHHSQDHSVPSAGDTKATTDTTPGPLLPPAIEASNVPAALTSASGPTVVPHASPSRTSSSSSGSSSSRSSSSSSSSSSGSPALGVGLNTKGAVIVVPVGETSASKAAAPASSAGFENTQQIHVTTGGSNSGDAVRDVSHRNHSAKTLSTAQADASAARGHTLRLSALRPILEVRDLLQRLKEKVTLIRLNEWDSNDPNGAPQDVRAVDLYNRLWKVLTGVAQRVTAGFLSKAGARPPRPRPLSVFVRPPNPQPKHKKTAREGEGAKSVVQRASQTKSLTSAATAHPNTTSAVVSQSPFPASGGTEGHLSPSYGCRIPTGAPHGTADVSSGDAVRLMPLSSSVQEKRHDVEEWWHRKNSRPIDDGPIGVPLVPNDALLQYVRVQAEPAAALPTGGGASAAVEVHPVYPDAPTVPNTSTTTLVRGGAAAPIATGPWAPTVSSTQTGGAISRVIASPVITLSAVPKVVMPVEVRERGRTETGPLSAVNAPLVRRRSTIKELSQLCHSPQRRRSEGRVDTVGAGSSIGDEASGRDPVTSITRGNFVVNAEYLSRVAPDALPVSLTTNEQSDKGTIDAQHAWADVDEDYFYFGRPVEKRIVPPGTMVAGPPYISTHRGNIVGVSPPVGMVVGSSRANAELVAPSMTGFGGVTTESTASRSRSSTGRRVTRDTRSSEHYLTSTASQSLRLQTARHVMRKEGAKHSFYTPGELHLMQARERLRSKPSKGE